MGALGFLAGLLYLFIRSRKGSYRFDDMVYVYVWSAISAVIGAKILYILIELPDVIALLRSSRVETSAVIEALFKGGFVYYGGLIGAFFGALLAIRYFKFNRSLMMPYLAAALPLVHAFGRVGCYFAGCCYGIKGFPIQLVEAGCNLLIFIVIDKMCTGSFKALPIDPTYMYFLMYCPIRFVLEFFRGDVHRGFIGVMSVSQWISILILIVLFAVYRLRIQRKDKIRQDKDIVYNPSSVNTKA